MSQARIIFASTIYAVVLSLVIVLIYEYRFYCEQARQLIELKEQYRMYIDRVNTYLRSNEEKEIVSDEIALNDEPELACAYFAEQTEETFGDEDGDEDVDEEFDGEELFVVLNRQPQYLKESTIEFIKSQKLDMLATRIDMDEWQDYTEQVFIKPHPEKIISKARVTVKKKVLPQYELFCQTNFIWPIKPSNFWLSSLFGPRKKVNGSLGFHYGIDMAAMKGTPVKAAQNGVVIDACYASGYGNTIVIKHDQTFRSRYAHLHTIRVHVGQKVKKGMRIGTVGETGFIRKKGKDGSHLHFEVYENGKKINPLHCLPTMS